ncbi:MarR family transcriptional regulator [bacterium]|nr:MarR family transcriptional regulator [bacterium]
MLSKKLIEFYDKLSSWENETVKECGLTLPQMHTLEVIGSNEGIKMKEITEKLGIVTGTLTVMIDRLTKLDLVRRVVNTNDKRSFTIELTAKGKALYQEHSHHHDILADEITQELNEEEKAIFAKLLDKILRRI